MARKKSKPSRPSSESVVAQVRGGGGASSFKEKAIEAIKSVGSVVLVFFVLRIFLVEAYRIPSGSMEPTLLIGDWLFVNKLRFGPHLPFTSINLPGYADPQREDVVVFESPTQIDQPWDPNPILVKRMVAIGGDTVFMRDGVFHLNGVAKRQGFAANNPVGDGAEVNPLFEWQHKYEITGSRFGAPPAQPTHDNWGPLVVPAGHYLMLGDNRYNSKDSRYWGPVPRANVRGRPLFVYYSYDADSDRPLPFLTDIRWRRLGHWIE
ncbi:MAG: signal peptidase I [Gemmatimonadetes bacterium]|nr:signal peptidase I [Gemmatimonadota bacterium]